MEWVWPHEAPSTSCRRGDILSSIENNICICAVGKNSKRDNLYLIARISRESRVRICAFTPTIIYIYINVSRNAEEENYTSRARRYLFFLEQRNFTCFVNISHCEIYAVEGLRTHFSEVMNRQGSEFSRTYRMKVQ